jgi:hypothetical protein
VSEISEPRIWSHITDVLPDGHPLAHVTVYCAACREMVHAGNNECMQTWVETGRGPHCLPCFVDAVRGAEPDEQRDGLCVLEDEWGLPA